MFIFGSLFTASSPDIRSVVEYRDGKADFFVSTKDVSMTGSNKLSPPV